MSGIGINKGLVVNSDILLGKEVGKFNTKKEAVEAASVTPGSEVIYEKDNKWHVNEVKEKGYIYNSGVSKTDEQKIELSGKKLGNVKDVTISFVEEDVKSVDKTKVASTTRSRFVLDKLANEKPISNAFVKLGIWNNEILKIKVNVASNPLSSPETLEKLSNESFVKIKKEVAKNPNTKPETLAKLSKEETMIAQEVANNKNTPADAMIELSKRNVFSINASLANNVNCPKELLKELANDTSGFVQIKEGVAGNPNTPKETLEMLSKDNSENSKEIKEKLLHNPNTPSAIKKLLVKEHN